MRWRRQQERVREIDGWWRDGALRSARGWFRARMKDEESDENRKCEKNCNKSVANNFIYFFLPVVMSGLVGHMPIASWSKKHLDFTLKTWLLHFTLSP